MDDAPAPASRPDAPGPARAGDGEVRLPADALRRLSRLGSELGAGGIAVLREAGRTAGRRLVDRVSGAEPAETMELTRFWDGMRRAAAGAGLGSVRYRVLEDDVGEVELRDSPEAASAPAGQPAPSGAGCHFAAGWIGGALTAAAGEPVAVLEVSCATGRASGGCRFLVGREARLEELRAQLRAGASLEEALAGR